MALRLSDVFGLPPSVSPSVMGLADVVSPPPSPPQAPPVQVADASGLVPGADRFGNPYNPQVDPRLTDIMQTAAVSFPLHVEAISGARAYNPKTGTMNHVINPKTGYANAIDVQIYDQNGRPIPNPLSAKTPQEAAAARPYYAAFAQVARQVQQQKYPELSAQFRNGLGFTKDPRYANDAEHFDLSGGADRVRQPLSSSFWNSLAQIAAPVAPMLAQMQSGMPPMAMAGPPQASGMAATPAQLDQMARTVLAEARGEGPTGMAAVAGVMKNRAALAGGVAPVIAQFGTQFANPMTGGYTPQEYQQAMGIVKGVLDGSVAVPQVAQNATYFANPKKSDPAALKAITDVAGPVGTLGNHVFYAKPSDATALAHYPQVASADPNFVPAAPPVQFGPVVSSAGIDKPPAATPVPLGPPPAMDATQKAYAGLRGVGYSPSGAPGRDPLNLANIERAPSVPAVSAPIGPDGRIAPGVVGGGGSFGGPLSAPPSAPSPPPASIALPRPDPRPLQQQALSDIPADPTYHSYISGTQPYGAAPAVQSALKGDTQGLKAAYANMFSQAASPFASPRTVLPDYFNSLPPDVQMAMAYQYSKDPSLIQAVPKDYGTRDKVQSAINKTLASPDYAQTYTNQVVPIVSGPPPDANPVPPQGIQVAGPTIIPSASPAPINMASAASMPFSVPPPTAVASAAPVPPTSVSVPPPSIGSASGQAILGVPYGVDVKMPARVAEAAGVEPVVAGAAPPPAPVTHAPRASRTEPSYGNRPDVGGSSSGSFTSGPPGIIGGLFPGGSWYGSGGGFSQTGQTYSHGSYDSGYGGYSPGDGSTYKSGGKPKKKRAPKRP